jgi:RNA polymerase sigma factor (sigma-70 family)
MHAPTALTARLPLSSPVVRAELAANASEAADVRAAARGDVDAFARLHRTHAERIHMLARRLVGSDAADEATQDVFVRAWTKLGSFRGDARFGTWLHRLAVNALLRRAQSTRRREQRDGKLVPELPAKGQGDPYLRLDLEAALTAIDGALRQVVVLHDMEGYTHEEIASLLGIGVSASRMRLSRARMALRAFMSEA